ncbi:MAG: 30S ribosomal protein S13 [Candidatus Woesearchaeota archaeon]
MAESENFRHIVRIAESDLEGTKPIIDSLRNVKGVDFMFSNAICRVSGISKEKRTGDLSDEEIKQIDNVIKEPLKYNIPKWMLNRREDYDTGEDLQLVGGSIRFVRDNDIKRMRMIKAYRGVRHSSGLPVRGQRIKANFRRNKGKVTGVKRKSGKK